MLENSLSDKGGTLGQSMIGPSYPGWPKRGIELIGAGAQQLKITAPPEFGPHPAWVTTKITPEKYFP